jgi:stage II sporulation protein D
MRLSRLLDDIRYALAGFPVGAVIFAALGISLVVLLLRGCFYMGGDVPDSLLPAQDVQIKVYDAKADPTRRMDPEAYLVGVVAAEMPASFEPEALKAQAVAARTYTMRRLSDPCGKSGAHICTDSTCCQAYRTDAELHENWGKNYDKNLAKITKAVTATRYQVALYDGELIEALYHSSSGGMTEDAQHVFAQAEPYLVGVESPGEEASAKFESQVKYSNKEFARLINKARSDAKLSAGKLREQVKIVSRYESGRVQEVKAGGATFTGRELREIFDLNSANFTFSFTDSNVVIDITGYGHGVGMSQYGANAMAKKGKDYLEILTHYYTGITVKELPPAAALGDHDEPK